MEYLIFHLIARIATPWLDFLMVVLSESCIYVILVVMTYFITRKNKRFPALFISVLSSLIIGILLKAITSSPRPCESQLPFMHEVFVNGILYCRDSVFPFEFGSSSFPSVHAAILFSILPFTSHDRRFFIGFLCYAILISLSRVYLGVHYPHDVLAGIVIGAVIGDVLRKVW